MPQDHHPTPSRRMRRGSRLTMALPKTKEMGLPRARRTATGLTRRSALVSPTARRRPQRTRSGVLRRTATATASETPKPTGPATALCHPRRSVPGLQPWSPATLRLRDPAPAPEPRRSRLASTSVSPPRSSPLLAETPASASVTTQGAYPTLGHPNHPMLGVRQHRPIAAARTAHERVGSRPWRRGRLTPGPTGQRPLQRQALRRQQARPLPRWGGRSCVDDTAAAPPTTVATAPHEPDQLDPSSAVAFALSPVKPPRLAARAAQRSVTVPLSSRNEGDTPHNHSSQTVLEAVRPAWGISSTRGHSCRNQSRESLARFYERRSSRWPAGTSPV